MGNELEIKLCDRKSLCVDCDNRKCLHAGDIGADCPKWVCDDPFGECENCGFIKKYQKEMRGVFNGEV